MFGIDPEKFLGLTVVAAIVSTSGTIIGIFIKDHFFARSFEMWKQRRALDDIYQKYKDPLRLSGLELASRLREVVASYPTVFLKTEVAKSNPERQIKNSIHDPYFQKYKLISTIYRFAAFLGWLELYRQDLTFMTMRYHRATVAFDESLRAFRSAFADGHLDENWAQNRDTLLFREELRAIGETMIESRGASRSVIGYAKFCELVENKEHNPVRHWSEVSMNFWLNLEDTPRDFRRTRIRRAYVHLIDAIELLDPKAVDSNLREVRNRMRDELRI